MSTTDESLVSNTATSDSVYRLRDSVDHGNIDRRLIYWTEDSTRVEEERINRIGPQAFLFSNGTAIGTLEKNEVNIAFYAPRYYDEFGARNTVTDLAVKDELAMRPGLLRDMGNHGDMLEDEMRPLYLWANTLGPNDRLTNGTDDIYRLESSVDLSGTDAKTFKIYWTDDETVARDRKYVDHFDHAPKAWLLPNGTAVGEIRTDRISAAFGRMATQDKDFATIRNRTTGAEEVLEVDRLPKVLSENLYASGSGDKTEHSGQCKRIYIWAREIDDEV
ncbi:hypothetical protein IAR55_003315 [Kwoniella newhampshirensis]|uniref:Uncharacterized protein n=1 Tax=Kwoniella newhampshirensis TaxID=1651941 RepID=A0AAW0YQK6_9TREE